MEIIVYTYSHCPFVIGMGDSEIMPSFVRCKMGGFLIDGSPTRDYDNPPPNNCPLRKSSKVIRIKLDDSLKILKKIKNLVLNLDGAQPSEKLIPELDDM
jgi:hypothetical protein